MWKITHCIIPGKYPSLNTGNFTIETYYPGTFELTDVNGRVLNVYENIHGQYKVYELPGKGIYFVRERKTGTVNKILIY